MSSEFLRVFNFMILCYSQNSRKLDARETLVLYSICRLFDINTINCKASALL